MSADVPGELCEFCGEDPCGCPVFPVEEDPDYPIDEDADEPDGGADI